jgi:hypothetical protein
MREAINVVPEVGSLNMSNKATIILNAISKPEVICGWCGAKEHYINEHKTECPNCEEYLD